MPPTFPTPSSFDVSLAPPPAERSTTPAQQAWIDRLSAAACFTNVKEVDALLTALTADPALGDPNAFATDEGGAPLVIALRARRTNSSFATVQRLLQSPCVDPDRSDVWGCTPLYYALEAMRTVSVSVSDENDHRDASRDVRYVQALLEAGANPNAMGWSDSTLTWNVVQTVANLGNAAAADLFDLLHARQPFDLEQRDAHGNTLLLLALSSAKVSLMPSHTDLPAEQRPVREAVAWLLAHGADVTAVNHAGEGALALAQSWREFHPLTLQAVEHAVVSTTRAALIQALNENGTPSLGLTPRERSRL